MAKAECPLCSAAVPFEGDTEVGEIVECEECGAELEVKSLEPAKVGEAPEEEEDWGE